MKIYPSLKKKIDESSQMLQLEEYRSEVIHAFLEFVYTGGEVTRLSRNRYLKNSKIAPKISTVNIPFTIEGSKEEAEEVNVLNCKATFWK